MPVPAHEELEAHACNAPGAHQRAGTQSCREHNAACSGKGLLTESILDIQGSRSRLREVIAKYPQLTNLPVGDFYKVR